MQAADSIKKIIQSKKLTHDGLAELLAVHKVQIGRYLSGERPPGAGACLVLAGLAENPEERRFWLDQSKLGSKAITLIAEGVDASPKEILSGDERRLLDWWRSIKEDDKRSVDAPIKAAVTALLKQRK